jgi:hypothetical protein
MAFLNSNERGKNMLVKVKPNVAIPHVIAYAGKVYSFEPTCETPKEYGEALVKNKSHMFAAVVEDEKINLSQYTVKDEFSSKTQEDLYRSLSSEDKLKVLDFTRKLAKGEAPKEAPAAKGLSDMTLSELKAFAEEKKIEIPYDMTKKADVLAHIEQNLKG